MARMDWRRATERDQARSRRDEATSASARSFNAKFSGTCATCGEPFAVGEPIASTFAAGKRVFSHRACLYGEPSSGKSSDDAAALAGVPNGRCHATTKKGDPCRGGAKKGELYCGPHLDHMPQPAQPLAGGTTVDPFDEPF